MSSKIIRNLDHWPRSNSGDPIFSCIEDSFFFAQLIFNNETERLRLAISYKQAASSLKASRSSRVSGMKPKYTYSMKCLYYQFCLAELGRIEREGPA